VTTTLVPPASPAQEVAPTAAPDASPRKTWRRPVVIEDSSRAMCIACYATRGQGKSRFLGRRLCFHDFRQGIPLVVIDPIGGTIDNLLDKINRRPVRERRLLWSRVRYINMNGGQDGQVVPWPIYQRTHPTESLDTTARRFVDVLTRADADLARAPIQGRNALAPLATAAGIILAALNLGITEMESLLTEPARWQPTLSALGTVYPDTRPAVATVQQLYRLSPRDPELLTWRVRSWGVGLAFDAVTDGQVGVRVAGSGLGELLAEGVQRAAAAGAAAAGLSRACGCPH